MARTPRGAALSDRRRWLHAAAALLLVRDALAAGKIEIKERRSGDRELVDVDRILERIQHLLV